MRIVALSLACALVAVACARNPEKVTETHYADGRLESVRTYTHGEKDGLHRGWWPDGTPKFECRYDNGRAVGTCSEWYETGRLATVHRYAKGAEAGLQQGWSPAGDVLFAYDMRDGRRYGVLGAMNCKTGARAPGAL